MSTTPPPSEHGVTDLLGGAVAGRFSRYFVGKNRGELLRGDDGVVDLNTASGMVSALTHFVPFCILFMFLHAYLQVLTSETDHLRNLLRRREDLVYSPPSPNFTFSPSFN